MGKLAAHLATRCNDSLGDSGAVDFPVAIGYKGAQWVSPNGVAAPVGGDLMKGLGMNVNCTDRPWAGILRGLLLVALGLGVAPVRADLPVEQYSVETLPFPPHPHRAYIADLEFDNLVSSRITVVDPDAQRYLGMISAGFISPMTLSGDGKTLYTADIFYSRGTRGERTDVLTAHDTATLAPQWEAPIPPKRLNVLAERFQLSLTDDDRFALITNFTPASSVSVVDVQARQFVGEIDIPGCSLNYPAGPRRFVSICGDGHLLAVTLNDEGREVGRERVPFFSPEEDLLFERAVPRDGVYYFPSFKGQLHSVDMRGQSIKVDGPWPLLSEEERKQGWRPGGWQLIALSPQDDQLFVLMHPNAYNGSHKDPSTSIWVYDLNDKRKIGVLESPAPIWSIHASRDDKAVLLGLNMEGGLEIFDVKSGQHRGTMPGIAKSAALVLTH